MASARSSRVGDGEPEGSAVAADHREVVVLVAGVEAEPEAEAVGQRDLLLDRLGRVDGGRALVLDHVARHQVAAVGGGVEHARCRAGPRCRPRAPPSATCSWLSSLVEGEVVAEQEEAASAPRRTAEAGAARRGDVLAVDLDQLQAAGCGRAAASACTALTSSTCPCRGRPRAARCWPASRGRTGAVLASRCRGRGRCPDQERERDAGDLRDRLAGRSAAACQTKASAAARSGRPGAAAPAPGARARRRCGPESGRLSRRSGVKDWL